MNKKLPKRIMQNVCWTFAKDIQYPNIGSLIEDVKGYYDALSIDEYYDFGQVVLDVPTVQIQYLYNEFDEEEDDYVEIEPIVTFQSENKKYFTAGELLFKIHNEVVGKMSETSAHFFEGFLLYEESADKAVPLYFMTCGS